MTPNLLFIVNNPAFFLSHRLNIARAAAQEGWSVGVATPPGEASATIEAEGFQWHSIPMTRSGANPLTELRTIRAIYRLLREVTPTIVHTVTIKPVLYTGLVAPWAKVPALVHAISGLGTTFLAEKFGGRLRRHAIMALYRLAFRHPNSSVIIQNSDDGRLLAPALRPNQAVLVPGAGVDPSEFPPTPEPPGAPLVILPARMLVSKGVRDFVEAAKILHARGVAGRFILVGDTDPGNPDSATEAQLRNWTNEGPVEWWGHRSMPEVFETASIVCLPTFYREGVPKVLIEAAASQRAIITTDVPGCSDVVENGRTGLLVPPQDPTVLAAAIERLIENPQLRLDLAVAARRRFMEQFTSDRIVSRTLRLYGELLKGESRVAAITEPASARSDSSADHPGTHGDEGSL